MSILAALLQTACTGAKLQTVLIGTYADAVYAFRLDSNWDAVGGEGPFEEAPLAFAKAAGKAPSYLVHTGENGIIYTVRETYDGSAAVSAWRLGPEGFEFLGSSPTGLPDRGDGPCHLAVGGGLLAASNFGSGTLSIFRIREDGSLTPPDTLVSSAGRYGQSAVRRIHSSIFPASGGQLLFAEFSEDSIGAVTLDGTAVAERLPSVELPEGTGPRDMLFDKSGRHLYVLGETSGEISVFDYDGNSLQFRQRVKADRADGHGAACLKLSPDGKFLYAGLRLKNDGIAIFSVGRDGSLKDAGYCNTGRHPRNFHVTPDGNFVLVACSGENAVEIYGRNRRTGALTDTGKRISVPRPVCIEPVY